MTTEEQVRQIIHEQFNVDPETVRRDQRIIEDFEADSLDTIELIMQAEDGFEIDIPDADAERLVTVGDAIDYIEKARKT